MRTYVYVCMYVYACIVVALNGAELNDRKLPQATLDSLIPNLELAHIQTHVSTCTFGKINSAELLSLCLPLENVNARTTENCRT